MEKVFPIDLSVITVTWNSAALITPQMISVKNAVEGLNYEHVVIDNASTDRIKDEVQNQPGIVFIANENNEGFAKANNQGLACARGKWLLFLNPDMLLEKVTLRPLLAWAETKPRLAIVGCRLLNSNGKMRDSHRPAYFPTFFSVLGILFKLSVLFPKFFSRGYHDEELVGERIVDTVRGSFMLMRRSFLEETGFAFDPRYRLFFEDVDICREARSRGWEVWYNPLVSCVDYVGQSFKQVDQLFRQKQFFASAVLYFKKWGSFYEWRIIQFFSPVGFFLIWVYGHMQKILCSHKSLLKDAITRDDRV